MSPHSPGPWELHPWTTERGGSGWGIPLVADQWVNIDAASEHSEANACLIAAAPDLADALFGLLVAIGEIGLTQAQTEGMGKACDEAVVALIACGRVFGEAPNR